MDIEVYRSQVDAWLGQEVEVQIDRPLGSAHPRHPDMIYKVNYGYVLDFKAPDGDNQDVYLLGVDHPVKSYRGMVVAIIRRLDDNEDKLVVAPKGTSFSSEAIEEAVAFQERYFHHILIHM